MKVKGLEIYCSNLINVEPSVLAGLLGIGFKVKNAKNGFSEKYLDQRS